MDYKRNRRYFESINWIFIGIIGVIAAILLYFYILIGIAILLGLGVYIYFKLRDRPTDGEIDDVFKEYAHTILQKGYGKLDLDAEDTNLIDPIVIHGPSIDPISYNPAIKRGKDGKVRSSNHEAIIFYFKEQQLYFYHQSFSIIDDEQNEVIREYSYRDIVTVSLGSTTTMYFDSRRRRDEFFNLEFVELITLGAANIACSVQDLKTVEAKINRMKKLIHQKKRT